MFDTTASTIAFRRNPFPWFQQARKQTPVLRTELFGIKSWSVYRYDDVQRVLFDYATFSSSAYPEMTGSMIQMDPPNHRQLRTLVSQAFTPRAVANMEGFIEKIVHELLDRVEDKESMDLIEDFAFPLPAIVIAEMLGVPAEDRVTFRRWSDQIAAVESIDPVTGKSPYVALGEYFATMLPERQSKPKNDLMSSLLTAQIDGEALTSIQLLSFCILLLGAGHETTTNLLSNAIQTLDEHPEVMEELRADPALIPTAIEEILRYRSPVQFMARITTQEVELSGHVIPAGEHISAWISSANRDETQFPDPDRFDIHRTPNKHIAFGSGVHFCLGAPLARLEASVALTILLDRWSDIKRTNQEPLEPAHSPVLLGARHLPITFRKR